jgi:hypothetical protein
MPLSLVARVTAALRVRIFAGDLAGPAAADAGSGPAEKYAGIALLNPAAQT